jgi:cystathionine beta-lyase
MKFNTKTIHGGQQHDPSTGAVMTPIFQTSTYVQQSPGKHKGYEYSRSENPTRHALEKAFASIENGEYGLAFSSGMAATDCVLRLFNPGDEIIAGEDIYGGSYRMFTRLFKKYGLKFTFVDMNNVEKITNAITLNTRLIWLETPSNPLLKIADIEVITSIAKENNILTAVDTTFATPFNQQPLEMGVDIVMHSATKYLGGHSDIVMGALMVKDEKLAKDLHFIQFAAGAVAGPMDCFLALRGLKTLALRMQRHNENGMAVAHFLNQHPKVEMVYYPGLENHENHEIAKRQMKGFGGMVSFRLKDKTKEATLRMLQNFSVFTLAESLGGVESLVSHPVTMSHASIPAREREKLGITDSLTRLSVGVEDIDDLIEDIRKALKLV